MGADVGAEFLRMFVARVVPILVVGGVGALALYLWLVWKGIARP